MHTNLFGAFAAFSVGLIIAAVNYALSRYVLKNHTSKYAFVQIIRQMIQVAYLVVIFVVADYTPWDVVWLLVGGGLGITLPMIFFTFRLVKLNDSLSKKEDSSNG